MKDGQAKSFWHDGETNRFGFPKVGMETKEFRAKRSFAFDTVCPTPRSDWLKYISKKSEVMDDVVMNMEFHLVSVIDCNTHQNSSP